MRLTGRIAMWAIVLLVLGALLPAQPAGEADLPERLGHDWILKFEQAYGIRGLYIDEPPPMSDSDIIGRVRRDLLDLTRAGRVFVEQFPGETPTPQLLYVRRMMDRSVMAPQGVQYEWLAGERLYTSTLGTPGDLLAGAWQQLDAMGDYRRRVLRGDDNVRNAWTRLFEMEGVPALIRREIETRDFFLRLYESRQIEAARRTQELLRQLNDAIEMATVIGTFEIGQPITMQDVGRTGFIDLLEALPMGGRYRVTRAGEPPFAVFGDREVRLDSRALDLEAARLVGPTLERNPDYPPALAIRARAMEGEEAHSLVNRAIEQWPDVPALRIQRLYLNARELRLEQMNEDLDFLLARFPAAPILLEIDLATRAGDLNTALDLRVGLSRTMAEIRPEVLLIQVIALREARRAGNEPVATEIFERVVTRHPGYVRPLGGSPMASGGTLEPGDMQED